MLRAGCTSGEAARGCQARHPRTERSANRPRWSRVHHPRASRTIRGAFLARPARGRFCSLRWASPRLGGLCQILANLGNPRFYEKTRFSPPPPLCTRTCGALLPTAANAFAREKMGSDRTPMARMHHPSHRRPITFLFLARPATGRFLDTEEGDPALGPGRRRRRRPCSGANLAQRSARRQARPLCIGGRRLRRHARAVAPE